MTSKRITNCWPRKNRRYQYICRASCRCMPDVELIQTLAGYSRKDDWRTASQRMALKRELRARGYREFVDAYNSLTQPKTDEAGDLG